jgi:formate hydrogenlyase subunit 3/multisubunit Na+/H+ antiporter MnhD subunit
MTSSREIFGEFFRQEQFIVVTHFLSILNSRGYPVFGTNFPTTIFINLEIIFLTIPVLIFFNLLIQNLFKLNILKLLKLICILYIFIKITNFFKNMFFYEVLNTALVLGVWETLISILISLLFLFFINGLLIQKNHFSFLFLSFFLYALTSLFFTNDFIVLYLILELQFFTVFGLILQTSSKNKLNTLFIYLFINILGTIFFLFGLIALYTKINSFNFNTCSIVVSGFLIFLPFGLLVKLTGIVTSIFFQKLYSKSFVQLYGIVLILNEGGLSLMSIKLFTKILILNDMSVLVV